MVFKKAIYGQELSNKLDECIASLHTKTIEEMDKVNKFIDNI